MKVCVDNYIGKEFGDLIVLGADPSNQHFNANRWRFKCRCGNEFSCCPSRVLSGHKKSCGCKKGKSAYIHGCNGDEFYHTWWSMMRRCYNTKAHNYHRYGGRGITVCEEWKDPKVFIDWAKNTLGHKRPEYSLDRIDNNKGYSSENCRWVNAKTQANNRRSNSLETINGVTKTLSEWCDFYQIKPETVRSRQKRGMSFFEAISTPVLDTKFKKK